MCVRMFLFLEGKMPNFKTWIHYFSKGEWALWCGSVGLIGFSFGLFDGENFFTLGTSLLGVTSLLFIAKGNPFGQFLMILFSFLYGVVSYTFSYYGEMMTYLGMTMPMAVCALLSWLKHPYQGNKAEVQVNQISRKEFLFLWVLTFLVSGVFFLLLKHLNTTNLIPSTFSVTTSFLAVSLTFRRSPYFALAYAANDLVLIVLWVLASMEDLHYCSVAVCFAAFFVNDLYGFVNWRKMEKRQRNASCTP